MITTPELFRRRFVDILQRDKGKSKESKPQVYGEDNVSKIKKINNCHCKLFQKSFSVKRSGVDIHSTVVSLVIT